MRMLKRLIIFFFIVVIGVPLAIGGAALTKDATPPDFSNFDYANFNINAVLEEKLQELVFANAAGSTKIFIDQDTINKIIYKTLKESPDSSKEIQVTDTKSIKLDALWTKFDNNKLSVYAQVNYGGVNTTLTMVISFSDIGDGQKISLDSVKIGKLPLPKMAFSYVLNNFVGDSLKDEYAYGDINYDELSVTIVKSYIQDLIRDNLPDEFIIFDNLELQDGKFILNYQFNDADKNAIAIKDAINNLTNLVQNGNLTTAVNSTLSDSNEVEKTVKDNFDNVMVIMQKAVNDPLTIDFTDTDAQTVTDFATSFQELPIEKQQEVAVAIESQFDQSTIDGISQTLSNFGLDSYGSLSDIITGGSSISN